MGTRTFKNVLKELQIVNEKGNEGKRREKRGGGKSRGTEREGVQRGGVEERVCVRAGERALVCACSTSVQARARPCLCGRYGCEGARARCYPDAGAVWNLWNDLQSVVGDVHPPLLQ